MAHGGAILVMALFTVSFRMTTQLVIHVSTDNEAFMRHLKNGKEIFHILRSIADFLALLLLVQGIEPNPGPLSDGSIDDIDLFKKRQQCADPGSKEMEVTTDDPTQTSEGESTLGDVGSATAQTSVPLAANDVSNALDKDQIVDLQARTNHLDITTVPAIRQDAIVDTYFRSYSIEYEVTSQTEDEDDIDVVSIIRDKDTPIVPMTPNEVEDIRMSYRTTSSAHDASSQDVVEGNNSDWDDDTASRSVSVHKAYPGIDVDDIEAIFGYGSSRQSTQGPSMDDDFCVSTSSDNESIYDVTEDKTEDTATSLPVVNDDTKQISRSLPTVDDTCSQYAVDDDHDDSVVSGWDDATVNRSLSVQNAYPGIDKDDLEAIFGRSSLRQSAQGPTMDDDFHVNSWSDDESVDGASVDHMGNDTDFNISPPAVIDDTSHVFRNETKKKSVTFAEKDTVIYFEKDMTSLSDDDSVLYDDDYEVEASSSDEDIIYDYTHDNDDESVFDRSSSSAIDAFSRDDDNADNTAVSKNHYEDTHVAPVVHIDEEDIDMLFRRGSSNSRQLVQGPSMDDDFCAYSSENESIDDGENNEVATEDGGNIHILTPVEVNNDKDFKKPGDKHSKDYAPSDSDDDFAAAASLSDNEDIYDDDFISDDNNIESLPFDDDTDGDAELDELNRQCTESYMHKNENQSPLTQALGKEDRYPILELNNFISDTSASRPEMPVNELLPTRSRYPAVVLSSGIDSVSVDIFDKTSAASTKAISPTNVGENYQASPQEIKGSSHGMFATDAQTKPCQLLDIVPLDIGSEQNSTLPIELSNIEISLLTSSHTEGSNLRKSIQDLQPTTPLHKTHELASEVHYKKPKPSTFVEIRNKEAVDSVMIDLKYPDKEPDNNEMKNLDIIEDAHGILVSMFYKPELSSIDKYMMLSHEKYADCPFLSQNGDASFTKTDVVMEKINDKITNEHINPYSDIVPEYLSLFTPKSGKIPKQPTDVTVNQSTKSSIGLKDGRKDRKSRITKLLHRMFH